MENKKNQSSHQTLVRIPHPTGLLRLAMRAPIFLYRVHLGWLLGKRFLLLEHRGRKSGVIRRTVIEVVDHNPQDGSFVVAAAWGMQSDWYKNILVHPQVTIQAGPSKLSAVARTLSVNEATQHLAVYAREHPFAFKQLGSMLIGSTTKESETVVKAFAAAIPLIQFIPSE